MAKRYGAMRAPSVRNLGTLPLKPFTSTRRAPLAGSRHGAASAVVRERLSVHVRHQQPAHVRQPARAAPSGLLDTRGSGASCEVRLRKVRRVVLKLSKDY